MLHAAQQPLQAATSDITRISGAAGKHVFCSQRALPIFNELVTLAKKGNYWAGLIVHNIQGLSHGRLNKDNIYIEQKAGLAYGMGAFHLVLPGVMATLEAHPNGSYILQHIVTDYNYLDMQKKAEQPGLWKVSEAKDSVPIFRENGRIENQPFRPVVITDTARSESLQDVADEKRDTLLADRATQHLVSTSGFDLHFTPGEQKIWGSSPALAGKQALKPARAVLDSAQNKKIMQSALLLANTMYQARDIEGVMWYSDWGGSAVLMRAMEILHQEKGITLDKHGIFMNHPTTRTRYALELGKKLGLSPVGSGKQGSLHPRELAGRLHISEFGGISKQMAAQGFALGGAGFGVASVMGLSGSAMIVATTFSVAGGMYAITKTVRSAIKVIKSARY